MVTPPKDGKETPAERSVAAFKERFDIDTVPTSPGCYLMRDEKGEVIYVGKAKNLRARIRTYLAESDTRYHVKFLLSRLASIHFLVTSNEKEALLLENSLIKEHKPRYNVRLKDDKTYVSLRINVKEDFPRVTVVRQFRKDGARYFGPYSSAQSVRETLRMIQRLFPLRTCADSVLNNRTRPCLYHQMGQCTAPCVGLINRDAYHAIVDQVIMVLEGRSAELEKALQEQIREKAEKLEFEEAAAVRDRLYALRGMLERQRTVHVPGVEDRDVFGAYSEGRFTEMQVLFFRGGKLSGGRAFSLTHRELPLEEMITSFLLQYYGAASNIPPEVLLPVDIEEADALGEVLSEERGAKVTVHWPQRGEKKALVELAARNAKSSFKEKRMTEKANEDLLAQVKEKLQLSRIPNRIECFDISTTQGVKPVGSMVVFEGGTAAKNRYRRFAIRQVEGQDDFAMLREVLLRRYKRAIEEDDLPDFVLIDGGKGQLNVALAALKDLAIEHLDAAGIAKSRALEAGDRSPERFFLPGRSNPVILPQHDPVVRFLARIRDEAHRFAVTYHRKRRTKAAVRSALTSIPGVGEQKARLLLNTFGSVARLREAPVDAIAALPGFSKRQARAIKEHLEQAVPPAPEGGE